MRRWYTPKEDTYIRRFYAIKGPQWVGERLDRTPRSIELRANKLGLESGVPTGYVPMTWVHPVKGGRRVSQRALNEAERAGALLRLKGRQVVYAVKESWAEGYAERLGRERLLERQTKAWPTTRDVAALVGHNRKTFIREVGQNYGAGRWFQTVKRVQVESPIRHFRWHPREVETAVRQWRREARP